jgi:hypothetical protein
MAPPLRALIDTIWSGPLTNAANGIDGTSAAAEQALNVVFPSLANVRPRAAEAKRRPAGASRRTFVSIRG